MFWDENTRLKLVSHNEESHQISENLENALDHSVYRV